MSYVHFDDRIASTLSNAGSQRQRPERIANAWERLAGWLTRPAPAARPQGVVRLSRNAWRSIARPDGRCIRCLAGEVVVTHEAELAFSSPKARG